MKFKYQAKTKTGEDQVGIVESSSRDAAMSMLLGHNLFILSLEEVGQARWYDQLAASFNKIKRAADPAALKKLPFHLDSYGLSAVSASADSSLTRSLLKFTNGVSIHRIAVRRVSCCRI